VPFLVIKPEPSGHPGPGTVVEAGGEVPLVKDLHYVFDWWVGDALVGSYPFFLVTDSLKTALSALGGRSGFDFAAARVSTSDFFRKTGPNRQLPLFWWLRVSGTAGVDDIGLSKGHALVVSARILSVLLEQRLEQAEISQFRAG
jgi:hypothetical protein